MQYEAFTDIFTTEFKSFTSRMWLDYCDETQKDLIQGPEIMQAMSARISSGWLKSSTNATAKRS